MSTLPLFEPDDTFTEPEGLTETVDDISGLTSELISRAVVSASDWTSETIISQMNKGNIHLNPNFQRRDAWDVDRKSKFIESLILGLPVPQIVLAEVKDKKGSFIVIDGKQRLLSIRQFAAKKDDQFFSRLMLKGMKIISALNKKSYVDLIDDPALSNDLAAFENQTIRTVMIRNWGHEDFLYEVFLRLNTGSVPLSPQELRQALHPGPFSEFIDIYSGESVALREILKSKKPDFRMRDAELLMRFYSFHYYLSVYRGNLKEFLDFTCSELNRNWEYKVDEIKRLANEFESAYKTAKEIFGKENTFKKWTGTKYEKQFNRAVFDVIIFHFTEESTRDVAIREKDKVEAIFKELCTKNRDFLSSIESTTKSIGATTTRINLWTDALNEVLGINLKSPWK